MSNCRNIEMSLFITNCIYFFIYFCISLYVMLLGRLFFFFSFLQFGTVKNVVKVLEQKTKIGSIRPNENK